MNWVLEYVRYAHARTHTHTPICAVVTIRRIGVLQILRKLELSIHVALATNKKGSSLQIQTPTHWHPIGRSMVVPPPVSSPSNILPISPILILMWNTQDENSVLRRKFGPKRDAVTGEWRRVHNEELYDMYCSSNVIGVIKSRRMR
jgi:hypothetical protein